MGSLCVSSKGAQAHGAGRGAACLWRLMAATALEPLALSPIIILSVASFSLLPASLLAFHVELRIEHRALHM